MDRNQDFKDRSGLITGAGSGIGRALAQVLAGRGAAVALADLNAEAVAKAAQAINLTGGRALAIPADVSQEDQVESLVRAVVSAFGAIDFLVYSASLLHLGRFADLAPADWDRLMDVNLRGAYLTCRAAAPHLIARGKGAVVIVSSGAGRSASITGGANYTVSKAGQIGLARHLAMELGPSGVRVNCVCPGVTITPMARGSIPPERMTRLSADNPLHRLAQPDELARPIAFLLSDEASFINGACLDVNGGRQMH